MGFPERKLEHRPPPTRTFLQHTHCPQKNPLRSWEYVPFTGATQRSAPFPLTFHEFRKEMQKNEKKCKKMRAFQTFQNFRLLTITPYLAKPYNNFHRFSQQLRVQFTTRQIPNHIK